MGGYTLVQWITFFYFYSFVGWIWESCYVSAKNGHWVNRGFLKGPMLPIYGYGAVMMLAVSIPFRDNLVLTWFAGMIGATALELVTGWAMEQLFKVRYWDYSYKKLQFRGYICLESSVTWGFFTILMTQWIHPPVDILVTRTISAVVDDVLVFLISIVFVIDSYRSIKAAFDMAKAIEAMQKIRTELDSIQVQTALLKKEAEGYLHENLGEVMDRMDELKIKVMNVYEDNKEKAAQYKQSMIEKLELLKELDIRNKELEKSGENIYGKLTKSQAGLLCRNPDATTGKRVEKAFAELKEKLIKQEELHK